MKSKADIEAYLLKAEIKYQEVSEGTWIVAQQGRAEQIVVNLSPPVVVCRVNVMEEPEKDREACFRLLLELNARELIHGAYGLESGKIVLTDTLQLENLDYNEFMATLDDLSLAVSSHYPKLSGFRKA